MRTEPGLTASRVMLRPIASPLPLGFLALAVGTFTIAGVQLSCIPVAQSPDAGLAVLTFVVPLQLVRVIYGFLARDPAASTGMALQAGGWFSIGLAAYTAAMRWPGIRPMRSPGFSTRQGLSAFPDDGPHIWVI